MGLSESVNDLNCKIERYVRLERTPGNTASESLAIDVLHHDEAAVIFF